MFPTNPTPTSISSAYVVPRPKKLQIQIQMHLTLKDNLDKDNKRRLYNNDVYLLFYEKNMVRDRFSF